MKLGVFTVMFGGMPLEAMLDHVAGLGLDAVEIGTGAYPGNSHCDPTALLRSDKQLRAFRSAIESRGLTLSALSCHGNPLHPQSKIARAHHAVFTQTVELARRLGVETVITFSGCPGADARATQPSWVVSPWPPEFLEVLDWQWSDRVKPYWEDAARLCESASVRVGIEMHPNFVVYNPETMLRLHAIAPDTIGCNFDPSHMFWQGVDPVAAIRALNDCIYHFHAKDCRIDSLNTRMNGVLDAKRYTREQERSWIFRTVGYGNDAGVWKDMMSALRLVGYDHVVSIEHEDSLMSASEGLGKAISFLRDVIIVDQPGEAYWA
ncbi:MAG: sugar phosphate isomerase/epimerase [Longimicrobiales bacterium]